MQFYIENKFKNFKSDLYLMQGHSTYTLLSNPAFDLIIGDNLTTVKTLSKSPMLGRYFVVIN